MNAPFYQPGRYRCEVMQQGIGEAKTGTPQFVMKVKVLEFENGEPVTSQYERTSFNAITDKTMQYLVKKLEALGFEHGSLKYLDPGHQGYQSFVGNIVIMFCKHEEDNQTGEPREKWDIAFGSNEPLELKPVDSGKLRQLDVLFGAAAKTKKAAPKPQPVAAVVSTDEPSDNDVPF